MLERRLQVVDQDNSWQSTALKVAFASTDMQCVDQHFGSAKCFAIYAVSPSRHGFVEAFEFGHLEQDGNEDKLQAKLEALSDCAAVYSQAVGASAIAQLRGKGVQPVKVSAGSSIAELLTSLQEELQSGPVGWLARALEKQRPDEDRFAAMASEGWEE